MPEGGSSEHADYEWLTARDHILRRPDTHVGAVHPRLVERTVLDEACTPRHVTGVLVSPAFEKLFDEILTNALDHRERDAATRHIHVTVSANGTLAVSNDGAKTITTTKWPGTETHTPQVLFHELNAGSNLGERNAHNVGGRNGVGATVVVLFSESLKLEVCNVEEKCAYTQTFSRNGAEVSKPTLRAYKNKTARTSVTFYPDYARLGMESAVVDVVDDDAPEQEAAAPEQEASPRRRRQLADDVRALLVGRAVDAAACTDAQVHVNGHKLAIHSLRHYALAYGGELLGQDATQEGASSVQVVVTTQRGVHVCFVNGVRCTGTLYDAVMSNLSAALVAKSGLQPRQLHALLAEHCSVFVRARVNLPSFTSQSKDRLDTPVSRLGVAVPTCEAIAKKLEKAEGVREHLAMRRQLAEGRLAKKAQTALGGKLCKNIAKYERATDLGRTSKACMLWVCEGDSAAACVKAGFSVVGRTHNGLYPLRGKLLNVYDLTPSEALKNKEVSELLTILHLDAAREYDAAAAKRLPYDVTIITDQDADGSHITGLLLALFDRFFPSVLRHRPTFLRRFVTPVLKVFLPGGRVLPFFSVSAYREYVAQHALAAEQEPPRHRHHHKVKYYKGLGTSTSAEAREYFGAMRTHLVTLAHTGEASREAVRSAFGKQHVAARREKLRVVDPFSEVDYTQSGRVAVEDFCDRELVHFWAADNVRSLPSVVDGLKPSQRKVLFTVLDGAAGASHKVAQLASDAARKTQYHHAEESLSHVAIKLAQDFMGGNNVNLLVPEGQFGTRHGEKASAPRYIFTSASAMCTRLLHPDDTPVLERLEEEGKPIEPRFYVPVVPLLLLNGADGIGTGFSTCVPSYALADLVRCCETLCRDGLDAPLAPLVPSVRGFKGAVEVDGSHALFTGTYEWTDACTLRITELPPGTKTSSAREHFATVAGVEDVVSHSTEHDVDVRVTFATPPSSLQQQPSEVLKLFKLRTSVSLGNFHAFDTTGALRKYDGPIAIVREHARVRLATYEARLAHQLRTRRAQRDEAEAKIRFAERVRSGELDVFHASREELLATLGAHGPTLLDMRLDDLTTERTAARARALEAHEAAIRALEALTPADVWLRDLQALGADDESDKPAKKRTKAA